MVVGYAVSHTCVFTYLVVVKRVPLFVVIELVYAIDFVTRHFRAFDLVELNPCVGHFCRIPHLVAGPPNQDAGAGRERIVVQGIHSDRFVKINVESKSRPSSPELGTCMLVKSLHY
jgi:hypothetical protein